MGCECWAADRARTCCNGEGECWEADGARTCCDGGGCGEADGARQCCDGARVRGGGRGADVLRWGRVRGGGTRVWLWESGRFAFKLRKQYEGEWGERARACCLAHAVGAVEHAVVEVDVDELRTVLHLPKESGERSEKGAGKGESSACLFKPKGV